jgi:ABC-type molybdate transport system substrate-binding protein
MDWAGLVSDGFNAVTINRWIGLVCGFTGFRTEATSRLAVAAGGSARRATSQLAAHYHPRHHAERHRERLNSILTLATFPCLV